MNKELKDLKSRGSSNGQNNGASGISDQQFQDLKKDIKDKMEVANKKINNLQTDSNHHDQEIGYIKDMLE